ncbi:hypothetical protein [Trueperella sp. LYQ141]|uniref:primosomal protein N' family DNA-binding protein n=1 Tax=Trueperella sp. LYQ141 TaxID=3391058 RepID=UPI003983A808
MNGQPGDDLFSIPQYEYQEELLALEPVAREIDADFARPVAQVLLDMPQPHMDRLFDYEIPAKMAEVPVGARVVVEIGAQRVDGFIVRRCETTTAAHLRPIRRIVSTVPVLTKPILELCQHIAARAAAPVADALRLAIPQRHARAEREFFALPQRQVDPVSTLAGDSWNSYHGGAEYYAQLCGGTILRTLCQLRARDPYARMLMPVISALRQQEKSVLILVPTPNAAWQLARDIERQCGEPVAVVVSEMDHARRYQMFLSVLTGRHQIVVGTRSAAWAPVQNLGLIAILDDQHAAYREPRSPYVHARDIALTRARIENVGILALNYGPSLALSYEVEQGRMQLITPQEIRSAVAQIYSAQDVLSEGVEMSRMPSAVFTLTRNALADGPVLFLVPRAGYILRLACENCRAAVTCPHCRELMSIPQPDSPPICQRCGYRETRFRCQNCGSRRVRATRYGSHRTAQEIGRAFRNVPLHVAGVGPEHSLDDTSRIVIATPGLIPNIRGGYAAGIVLDAGYLLLSQRLTADEQFVRTMALTATHIRPMAVGGKLLIVGHVPANLIDVGRTWNMAGWAKAQLAERQLLALPPTTCWVEVTGSEQSVRELLGLLRRAAQYAGYEVETEEPLAAILPVGATDLIPGMSVLGPQHEGEEIRVYLRYQDNEREEKTALIYQALREASVKRRAPGVHVRVDPQL